MSNVLSRLCFLPVHRAPPWQSTERMWDAWIEHFLSPVFQINCVTLCPPKYTVTNVTVYLGAQKEMITLWRCLSEMQQIHRSDSGAPHCRSRAFSQERGQRGFAGRGKAPAAGGLRFLRGDRLLHWGDWVRADKLSLASYSAAVNQCSYPSETYNEPTHFNLTNILLLSFFRAVIFFFPSKMLPVVFFPSYYSHFFSVLLGSSD